MANISNTISIKITSDTKTAKQSIDSLSAKLKELKKVSSGLNIKISGLTKTTVENVDRFSQINSANIDRLAKSLTALSNVGKIGYVSKKTVEGISNLVAEVDKIKPASILKIKQLADAMQKMSGVSINVKGLQKAASIKEPSGGSSDAETKASEIASTGVGLGSILGISTKDLKAFTSKVGAVVTIVEKAIGVLGKGAAAFVKIATAVFKATTVVERFVLALGKIAVRGIINKIEEISKKINKAITAISRIAVYRALRRAIQIVAQAFVTGTENLYEYSRAAGTSLYQNLDKMSSALMQMKNAIGTAVAPLINAFTPAILTVINAVTVLCDKIAQFISLLSGVSKYTKAIGTSFSFEDAISGVGSAAGSASKELNKFTTSIDELNVISDTSSGGGGGSSYDSTTAFTESISTWWSDLAEIFNEGQFVAFGHELANKFNAMIESIDLASLGTKFGQKVRDMAEIAFGFLSTFDTSSIGKKIADFFNNAIGNIPWNLVGTNWGLAQNKLIDLFTSFVKGLNFQEISKAIAEFFNGAIETIDIVTLADGISTAAIEIVGGLADAITQMDLGTAFDKLFQAGMKFMENLSESDVVDRVIGALNHIIESIQPENVVEFINELVDWFEKCWIKMKERVDWDMLCKKIGYALANINWGEVLKLCFSIIKSCWEYTKIFTTDVWTPLCKSIASAFHRALVGKVNDMLGINTDSNVGEKIVNTLKAAIEAAISVSNPFFPLYSAFGNVIKACKVLWNSSGLTTDQDAFNDYMQYTTWDQDGTSRYSGYASGGFPTTGDYFFANENGPELVGRIGNRTAVANQGQIVDAVSAGVYEAVVSAFGGQKSSRENINLSVYLDGKQIESSVRKTTQNRGANIATGGVLNYSYS